MYKGITVHFELEDGWWISHFCGRESEYALKALDSHWSMHNLWPIAKRTIDMHLRETGYVP